MGVLVTARVFTVREAAAHIGRSQAFVRLLIADTQVVARKYRGRWYVSADSLDGWVVAGAVEPTRPDPGYVIPGVVNGRKAAA